jgi:hypothetical protein
LNFAGESGGQIEVVINNVFEMDAGHACVSEQRSEGWFAFVIFVLRDAAVVHVVLEIQTREHLRLRQAEPVAYLA